MPWAPSSSASRPPQLAASRRPPANLADTFDTLFSSPGLGAQLVAFAAVSVGAVPERLFGS
jgi:hypothetical protein